MTALSVMAIATPTTESRARPRLRVDSAILGMVLLLMAETMFFAGLISAAVVLRAQSQTPWPPADQPRLPAAMTLANMLVLLSSGAALALCNGRRRLVAVAAALGALFFAVQGYEWSRLLSFGLRAHAGPFAGIFYGLIATHCLHVAAGVLLLLGTWHRLARGTHRRSTLRVASMFWYFVVGVWPILYLLLYV